MEWQYMVEKNIRKDLKENNNKATKVTSIVRTIKIEIKRRRRSPEE